MLVRSHMVALKKCSKNVVVDRVPWVFELFGRFWETADRYMYPCGLVFASKMEIAVFHTATPVITTPSQTTGEVVVP